MRDSSFAVVMAASLFAFGVLAAGAEKIDKPEVKHPQSPPIPPMRIPAKRIVGEKSAEVEAAPPAVPVGRQPSSDGIGASDESARGNLEKLPK